MTYSGFFFYLYTFLHHVTISIKMCLKSTGFVFLKKQKTQHTQKTDDRARENKWFSSSHLASK